MYNNYYNDYYDDDITEDRLECGCCACCGCSCNNDELEEDYNVGDC